MDVTEAIKTLIETLTNYELSLLNTLLINDSHGYNCLIVEPVSTTFHALHYLTSEIDSEAQEYFIVFITNLLHERISPQVKTRDRHETMKKIDHSFMGYT